MNNRMIKFFIGCILLVGLVALRYSSLSHYISLDFIQQQRLELLHLVHDHYAWSVMMYIVIYMTAVALFLPLPALLTLTGGYLFGALPAVIYANIGATMGAVISFLLVRYLIGDWIQERYADRLKDINAQMSTSGSWYLLTIHFVAVIPFFLLNIAIGLTNVSLWTFIWTTSLGILPGTSVYAYAGKKLRSINAIQDVFTGEVIFAFILLTALAFLPIIIQRIKKRYKFA